MLTGLNTYSSYWVYRGWLSKMTLINIGGMTRSTRKNLAGMKKNTNK